MVAVAVCEYCSAGLLLKHLLSSCDFHCVSHLYVVLKINHKWVRRQELWLFMAFLQRSASRDSKGTGS